MSPLCFFSNKQVSFVLLCSLSLALFSGCATARPVMVEEIPQPRAFQEQNIRNANNAAARLASRSGFRLTRSGKHFDRAERVLNELTDALDVPRAHFPLFVGVSDDVINAFAVNGTTIVVTTGALERLQTDGEVATLLAHELGHILAGHKPDGERKQKAATGAALGNALGTIASVALGIGTGNSGLARLGGSATRTTTQTVARSVILSYDRFQEHEADVIGMLLMAEAGYHPEKAIRFWERSSEIFGGRQGGFLSTHPGHNDRAATLRKNLPEALRRYEGRTSHREI